MQDLTHCPQAQFDITTGKCLARPAKKEEPVYEVRVENGAILAGR